MNALILLGRILLSIIFILSGYGKVATVAAASGFAGYLTSLGIPQADIMAYVVGVCEVVGGVAILLGFQTRIVAVLLALFCIASALLGHFNLQSMTFPDQNQMISFLKNLAIAGGFFVLAGSGPGSISVDRR